MATLNINLDNVQPTLVSGTNIKTINGVTLLGSTDIALQTVLVSGTSIKTVNGTSILGSGDLTIASGISIGDTIGSGTAGSVLFWVLLGCWLRIIVTSFGMTLIIG